MIPEWFKTLAFITMGSIMVVFLMCIVAFIVVAIVAFREERENKNRRLK